MATIKIEATISVKALVPLHRSTRNHISEQINKSQKNYKGQYKIQIVSIMNAVRLYCKIMTGVARSSKHHSR
jgi:hypothetical protein